MATFDGWNAQQDSLMHFRTKGSKNGVRRYQNRDGSWTSLGLQMRKAREGWGKNRAQKRLARAERHQARREARAKVRAVISERKRQNSLKGLTDSELQKKIARLKMEQEYKELSRSPFLKAGEKLVTSYFEAKGKKIDQEMKRAELAVKQQEARQKTIAAKAALSQARGNVLDNLIRGAKYKQAQSTLINTKADKTIRGALRQVANKVITKEGNRIVSEMGNQSLVMRGGRAVKSAVDNSREKVVSTLKDAYVKDNRYSEERRRNAQKKRDRKLGQELRG